MRKSTKKTFLALCATAAVAGIAWAAPVPPSGALVDFDYSETYTVGAIGVTAGWTFAHAGPAQLASINMGSSAGLGDWQFVDGTPTFEIDGFNPNVLTVSNAAHSINQTNALTFAATPGFVKNGAGQLILAGANSGAADDSTIVNAGSLVIRNASAIPASATSTLTTAAAGAVSVDVLGYDAPDTITNAGAFEVTTTGEMSGSNVSNSGTFIINGTHMVDAGFTTTNNVNGTINVNLTGIYEAAASSVTANAGIVNINGTYQDLGATVFNNTGALNVNGTMVADTTTINNSGHMTVATSAAFDAYRVSLESGSMLHLNFAAGVTPAVHIGTLEVVSGSTIHVAGPVGTHYIKVDNLVGTPVVVDALDRIVTWSHHGNILALTIMEGASLPNVAPATTRFDGLAPADQKFVLNGAALTAATAKTLALSVDGKAITSGNYSFDGRNITIGQGFFKTLADGNHTVLFTNTANNTQVGKFVVTVVNNGGGNGDGPGSSSSGCNAAGLGAGVLLLAGLPLLRKKD